jgi:hypothetical protein
VGVGNVSVDEQGHLIVTYTDLRTSDAGSVIASLSVGSVTQGSSVSAAITGLPTNQVLDLVLPNATALGLGNVTNESKTTMFTAPTFTGPVTITGSKTGAVKINGQKVLTQSQVIALQVALS